MVPVFWIVVAFLSGSLPWSVWVGKAALDVDIRRYGDGNPGATNVFRAGGKGWGLVALLLDFLKGLLPVAVAVYSFDMDGWALTAVALAPILGHAYSPLLGGHGGKALAVTFGIWTGLSLFLVPLLLGLLFAVWLVLVRPEGWAVLGGGLCLCLGLFFGNAAFVWQSTAWGMTLILGLTHLADLQQKPALRLHSK